LFIDICVKGVYLVDLVLLVDLVDLVDLVIWFIWLISAQKGVGTNLHHIHYLDSTIEAANPLSFLWIACFHRFWPYCFF